MKHYSFSELAEEINTLAFCEDITDYYQIGYNKAEILKDIKTSNRFCLENNDELVNTMKYISQNKEEFNNISSKSLMDIQSADENLISSEELRIAYLRSNLEMHREMLKEHRKQNQVAVSKYDNSKSLAEIANNKFGNSSEDEFTGNKRKRKSKGSNELNIQQKLKTVKFLSESEGIEELKKRKDKRSRRENSKENGVAIILIAIDTLGIGVSQLIDDIASENIVFIITKNNASSMKRIGILKEDNRNILVYCKDNSLELINKYYE